MGNLLVHKQVPLLLFDHLVILNLLDMVMQNFLIVGLTELQVVFELLARQVIARLKVAPTLTLLGEVVPRRSDDVVFRGVRGHLVEEERETLPRSSEVLMQHHIASELLRLVQDYRAFSPRFCELLFLPVLSVGGA